ncbi:MAG: hypothetical protein IPM13_08100 [Phycisphaerales bacterium]|nr:hypothetical protein [Phycisphaerales bacterium]
MSPFTTSRSSTSPPIDHVPLDSATWIAETTSPPMTTGPLTRSTWIPTISVQASPTTRHSPSSDSSALSR